MSRTETKRPHFAKVSPIVYASAWSFAILNIFFLAPAFFYGSGAKGLSLVGLIPSSVWGVAFIIMGACTSTALIFNHWKLIKIMMMVGLFVKAMFGWALFLTLFLNFANIGVVGIWLSLMMWQGLCIIYFTPLLGEKHGLNK